MTRDDILLKAFARSHPLEAARVLERLPEHLTAGTLEGLEATLAARLFEHMSASQAAKNILLMQTTTAAGVIEAMPLRDGARLLRKLSPGQADGLLARVEARQRLQLVRQLRYPADTVAAVMNPRVFTLPDDITVAEAQKRIERDNDLFACDLYVVNARFKPVGVLQAASLLRAGKNQRIAGLANRVMLTLPAYADIAAVREMAEWNDHQSLPVVEKDGTLIGALHYQEIVQHEMEDSKAADLSSQQDHSLLELCWLGLAELTDMLMVHNDNDAGRGRS